MGNVLRTVFLAVAVLAAFTSVASAETRTLTVSGTATIQLANDTAAFSITTEAARLKAADAQAVASKRMARLLRAIEAHGVARSDMRTEEISVYRTLLKKSGPKQQSGYKAINRTSIKSRNVEGLGALYEMVYRLGADDVSSPIFSISQIGDSYRDAFVQALGVAVQKAQAVVAAAGGTLGTPLSVVEGRPTSERQAPARHRTVYRTYRKRVGKRVRTIREPVEVPVEGGTTSITAGVDVVFELL